MAASSSPPLHKDGFLVSKEDLFKQESQTEAKRKHRSLGEELPSLGEVSTVSHEGSPVGNNASVGEGGDSPSPATTPSDSVDPKKKDRFSFLMKASSMLKDISSSTSLKSKKGSSSSNQDKGDKWINLLAE